MKKNPMEVKNDGDTNGSVCSGNYPHSLAKFSGKYKIERRHKTIKTTPLLRS